MTSRLFMLVKTNADTFSGLLPIAFSDTKQGLVQGLVQNCLVCETDLIVEVVSHTVIGDNPNQIEMAMLVLFNAGLHERYMN